MADTNGNRHSDLVDLLRRRGQTLPFFQAVRLCRLLAADRLGQPPDTSRPPVRFKTPASLAFSGAVERIDYDPETRAAKIVVGLMGVVGPSGVLPWHYTREMMTDEGQTGGHAFLDIFNHRLIELFFSSWERTKFFALAERHASEGLPRFFLDIGGFGTPGLTNQAAVGLAKGPLRHFAGLLAQRPRSALAITQVLSAGFGVPVAVKQFQGSWVEIPPGSRPRLAQRHRGQVARLGVDAICGSRRWEHQSMLVLRIGPLQPAALRRLLPTDDSARMLGRLAPSMLGHMRAAARLVIGAGLGCRIQLVLEPGSATPARLGTAAENSLPPLLGISTWIGVRRSAHTIDEPLLAVP